MFDAEMASLNLIDVALDRLHSVWHPDQAHAPQLREHYKTMRSMVAALRGELLERQTFLCAYDVDSNVWRARWRAPSDGALLEGTGPDDRAAMQALIQLLGTQNHG